jgi:hypothetical protein
MGAASNWTPRLDERRRAPTPALPQRGREKESDRARSRGRDCTRAHSRCAPSPLPPRPSRAGRPAPRRPCRRRPPRRHSAGTPRVRASSERRSVQLKLASTRPPSIASNCLQLHRDAPDRLRGLPPALGHVERAEPRGDVAGERIAQLVLERRGPAVLLEHLDLHAAARLAHHHLRPREALGHSHRRELDVERRGAAHGRRRRIGGRDRAGERVVVVGLARAAGQRQQCSGRNGQRGVSDFPNAGFLLFISCRPVCRAAATRDGAPGSRSARAPSPRRGSAPAASGACPAAAANRRPACARPS